MPSEGRKIKDNMFHYQLIKERKYPGDYFLDIQSPTFPIPFLIFSLYFFFYLFQHVLLDFPASQLISILLLYFSSHHDPPNSSSCSNVHLPYKISCSHIILPTMSQKGRGIRYSLRQDIQATKDQPSSEVEPCQPSNAVNSSEKTGQLLNNNKSHNIITKKEG